MWLVPLVASAAVNLSCSADQEGVALLSLAGSLEDGGATPIGRGQPRSLRAILQRTLELAEDDSVSGALVRIGALEGGPARFGEVQDALIRLSDEGVRVSCHLESGSNYSYWLAATACERIALSPAGSLEITGLATESYYLLELLDSLGIEGDFLQVGTHKGAAEFLTRGEMSPETRETLGEMLDDLTEEILDGVSAGRSIDRAQLRDLIDRAPFDASAALEAGLIDAVEYRDEALEALQESLPGEAPVLEAYQERPQEPQGLLELLTSESPAERSGPRVAVLYLSGPIVSGGSGSTLFGQQISASQIRRIINEIRENPDYRALVLRIESPGGSALASDELWHELIRLRGERPIVATMGDVAASGGYYLAAAASEVFAEPGTLTGSIGVVGGKVVFGDLAERHGVNPILLKRGRNAGLASLTTPFTESQRSALQQQMETIYERFVQCVVEGRAMDEEQVRALATGRVWTGRRALELGLVDHLGGLHEAIALARELGGLPEDGPIEVFPKPLPLVQQLEQTMNPPSLTALLQTPTLAWLPSSSDAAERALTLALLLEQEPALTYWPLFTAPR